jgi:hypothetical protein
MDVSVMKEYINNFDTIAQDFIQLYSVEGQVPLDADDVKGLFNMTIYGGKFSSWYRWMTTDDLQNNWTAKKLKDVPMPPFYVRFLECINTFSRRVSRDNQDLLDILRAAKPTKDDAELERCLMSYYLQCAENHCLYHAYKYAVEQGWIAERKVDLCYDGFTAKLLDGCPPIAEMLAKLNAHIADTTGLSMVLKDKPLKGFVKTIVDLPSDNRIVVADDHAHAAEIMMERIRNKFVSVRVGESSVIYYLDDNHKWVSGEKAVVSRLESECIDSEIYKMTAKGGITSFLQNYGDAKSVAKILVNKITHQLCDRELYDKFRSTTRGFLCFNNGVLNAKTKEFRLWCDMEDGEIYTTSIIPRDYTPNYDREIYDKIKRDILEPMFLDKTQHAAYYIAKSIVGEAGKDWATYKGARDCGKGVLYSLLKNTFGDYVGAFNLANIMYSRKTEGFTNITSTSAMSWCIDIEHCRLVISQEVPEDKSDKVLHGETLKKFMSGGDTIHARKIYENTRELVMNTGIFILGNHELKVDDVGVNEHRLDILGHKSFITKDKIDAKKQQIMSVEGVDETTKDALLARIAETDYIGDDSIKEKVKTEEYTNAALHLFLDYYHQPISLHTVDENPDDDAPLSLDVAFVSNFAITRNTGDVILMNEVYEILGTFPKKDVKAYLARLGCEVKKNKGGGEIRDKLCAFGLQTLVKDEA